MSRLFSPHVHGRIEAIDGWLDEYTGPRYKEQPLAQDLARIIKLSEESGELVTEFIGITAQNPRKGEYGTREDFLKEGADVALTAVYMINHFTKNPYETDKIINARLDMNHERMIKSIAESRSHP